MSSLPDPDEFRQALLRLVNEVLPPLQTQRAHAWVPVQADTPLFATGRLDSLSILHLIGAIEELTGAQVPDHLVSMKHFQSINTLTETFCHEHVSPTH